VADVNWTALIIFIVLFALITVLGFVAAHWRKGDLDLLHEWGLGGRRFGTIVTWFLIGGDLYTAYTFIAVPALAFGAGAIAFFAVPYTIMIYPILFLVFPRLWYVCHKHSYITAADFVRGRFGNRWLALAIAITGIVASRCSWWACRLSLAVWAWSARAMLPIYRSSLLSSFLRPLPIRAGCGRRLR
jgi:solute:Na+ symporter, SSS family